MEIYFSHRSFPDIKFIEKGEDGEEIGRASLFIIDNDLHDAPYGLLEDLSVHEGHRGNGVAKNLIEEVITKAKKLGCYKLIATSRLSRPEVHDMFESMSFENYGIEFRMNL